MLERTKINIQIHEDIGEIWVDLEVQPRENKDPKIKYLSSDVIKIVEEQTKKNILSVLQNCMVSNYNEEHLKGRWIFTIEKKKREIAPIVEVEAKEEEEVQVVEPIKTKKSKKKEIDE